MAGAEDILGRNVANPTELDTSGLASGSSQFLDFSVVPDGREQSTLNIDPSSMVDAPFDPGANVQDIDLAQPRVPEAKPETSAAGRTAANERAAAIGGVAGTAISSGVSIWATLDSIKSEDKIFMEKIQRGHETLEFNQRMIRNSRNMSALNASLNAIDSLNKQGGNISAGGQEQLFLRSPNSGRLV